AGTQPLLHRRRAVAPPRAPSIELGNEREHLAVCGAHQPVQLHDGVLELHGGSSVEDARTLIGPHDGLLPFLRPPPGTKRSYVPVVTKPQTRASSRRARISST